MTGYFSAVLAGRNAALHENAIAHALKSRGEFNHASYSACEKTHGETSAGWTIVDSPISCRKCINAIRQMEAA